MATWENPIITNKGIALQAKLHSGTTLSLTRAVAGAGRVEASDLQNQTAVTDERQELTFSTRSYPSEGKCTVPLKLTNTDVPETYVVTQIGIYAFDPDDGEVLFMIAQAAEDKGTEIPSNAEMAGYTSVWAFNIQYGQADGITVTVDPANAVTTEEVEAIVGEHTSNTENPHGVTAAQLGLGDVNNTADSEKYVKYASNSGTADKVGNNIVVRLNGGQTEGTDQFTFNGSVTKSVNVTADKIGAAADEHTHSADDITSGTVNIARIPTITAAKGGTGATNGATGLKNLLAAGNTILSSYQYGTSLPAAGNKGRIFFKKVSS